MKIVCLDSPLALALDTLGHQILRLDGRQGVLDIADQLDRAGFQPDLLIQTETLHNRVMLRGMEQLECRTVFCAVDTHLNMHWHKYYARLFDLVLTPHLSFYEQMPAEWTPGLLGHWSIPGAELPFRAYAVRGRKMVFVGLTEAEGRPLRRRFLGLLNPLGLEQVRSVYGQALFDLYCDTWLLPNEAIAFEVNFRLTEGASAGCCVLGPDVGEDQNRLFEPDKEILVYEHGLDLLEKTAFLLRHPHLAEKMGQAARARVLAEHLPAHKALALLAQCEKITHKQANPLDLDLALVQRGRHVASRVPDALLDRLFNSGDTEAMAVAFRSLYEFTPDLAHLAKAWLARPELLDRHLLPALLGYALQSGNLGLFSLAWSRLNSSWSRLADRQPESLYQAALFLDDAMHGLGRFFQLGFNYQPLRMLPETCLEALQSAEHLSGGDPEWARRLCKLGRRSKGLTYFRQCALLRLTSASSDWREFFDYGLASLQAYDLDAAMPALNRAAALAQTAGKQELLAKKLRKHGLDPARLT